MKLTTAIILAGGLGTRLRSAVPDLPKCMAPVNGYPFIGHVIRYFETQGIEQFIFSLGYRSEDFIQFIEATLPPNRYRIVIEETPLGTGGAIQLACRQTEEQQLLVLNGDSIFKVDVNSLAAFHDHHQAACTLALKAMRHFERYGVVVLDEKNRVSVFKEKQSYQEGTINGGVYVLDRMSFLEKDFPVKFSFETDYLQEYHDTGTIYGMVQEGYFIDIGVPGDYAQAQLDFS